MTYAIVIFILAILLSLSIIFTVLITASIVVLMFIKAPYVPTPSKNVSKAIDALEIIPGKKLYDLGCGDGRFLIAAQQKGAQAIGYEISPWAYHKGKLNLKLHKSTAQIIFNSFYKIDLSDADYIICFLLPSVMPKVEKKLLQELKPGAKVMSYGFAMPNWQPTKIITTNNNQRRSSKIYLYTKQ